MSLSSVISFSTFEIALNSFTSAPLYQRSEASIGVVVTLSFAIPFSFLSA